MSVFRILALGDVVGQQAVDYIGYKLSGVISERGVDFTVANGENAYMGNGLDTEGAKRLLASGIDVLTSGNHIWKWREFRTFLDTSDRVIRPANYRGTLPGQGYTILNAGGYRILVMNVMGTSFLDPLDSPFGTIDRILEFTKGKYDFSVLDVHAEATGEKYALGRYFDGRVNVVFGTHTHVPTADDRVFQHGTGFVCDLGMCGPTDSILGVKSEIIIEKLMTYVPIKYEVAQGKIECSGVIFDIDTDSGSVIKTERITF